MKRFLSALLILVLLVGLLPAVTVPQAAAAEVLPQLTWNQGTHYGTVKPTVASRKYTVIPCQEGEIYHFDFPSDNWAIYVHFGDAEGDFGVEYLYRTGKPLDVVVREVDGRVPTELRLTTYYRPDTNATLDDTLWATFDVTIHKSTVVKGDLLHNAAWNQGTPANPSTALRKHTVIPCQVGDIFRFGFVSAYWDVYVLPADENGPLTDDDTYFSKDGTYTVAPVDGKEPTAIVVVAVPDPQGTSITDEIWSSFCVSCVKEGNTFTFATQNFGLWNDGVNQGVAADQVEQRAADWQNVMKKHDIDILVGQEWLPQMDSDKTVDANNKVFGSMYPYTYGQSTSTYDGKNIISQTPLTDITYTGMVSNVGRRYAKAYTVIDGKKVCIINAHLSFEEDINTNRKEEIVELLNVVQGEKYVIIAGDFNVFTPDEFAIFEEAGYSLANAGEFGEMNTWPNLGRNPTADVNRVLDNIIVSPGIKIHDAYTEDHRLSDHALLVAELELLEDGAFTDERLYCEHCHKLVDWTPITATNGGTANAILESGHYYLTQDLTKVNSQFYIGNTNGATPDVVLDLRGHCVKSTARAFYVRKNSKLTVVDTVGCGTVSAASASTGGFAYIEGGTTFSLYDGSLYSTDTTTAKKGGVIYGETGSAIRIHGGEIYGGYASEGGVVQMYKGTLTMTGGLVSGGTATGSGGCFYLRATTAELTGGTVTGGSGSYGGNIHMTENNNGGYLELGNCAITGGTASGAGKDIYLSGTGKLKVLTSFAGTSYLAVNSEHLPGKNPGDALNTSLDSAGGHFPGKLLLESVSGNPQVCGADGETSLYIASAALADTDQNLTWYAHNKSAVAHYGEAAYLLPAAGSLELTGGSYMVDLGGKSLEIKGLGAVTCFDSANDTYKTFGTASISGPTLANAPMTEVNGKNYVTLCKDGLYSFHRLEMGISGVGLRPSIAGIYYNSTWNMDSTLADELQSFGVAVTLSGAPTPELMAQDKVIRTVFGQEDLQNDTAITGVMIANIFKEGEETNDERARRKVYGATYLTLKDGTVLVSRDSVAYSLYDVVKLADETAYADHAQSLESFYAQWESVLSAWELKNTGK